MPGTGHEKPLRTSTASSFFLDRISLQTHFRIRTIMNDFLVDFCHLGRKVVSNDHRIIRGHFHIR